MNRLLLLALTAVAFVARPADAATFIVTVLTDGVDAVPGDGTCADGAGACTLRAAIGEANALAGDDTIMLGAGTHALTLTNPTDENLNASGDLDITSNIGFFGAGPATTIIDASGLTDRERVFHIPVSATVTMFGLQITGGRSDATSGSQGGGILAGIGTASVISLSLDTVMMTGNLATGDGGAIDLDGNVTFLAENSTFTQNTGNFGGVIDTLGGTNVVTFLECSLIGNSAVAGSGGAIDHYSPSTLRVERTLIANNSASTTGGGGLNNSSGNSTIINSTFSGNTLPTGTSADGGAIRVGSNVSVVLIENSTITGNTTVDDGGGIASVSTTAGGAGSVTLRHTIVANNTSVDATNEDLWTATNRTITLAGYNIIEVPAGGVTAETLNPGTNLNVDPLLGPLASNGGPTQTHALLVGSPAIDSGSNPCSDVAGGFVVFDQRAYDRTVVPACDRGAYEFGAPIPVELTSFTGTADGTSAQLRWTTASETNNAGFEVQALRGAEWTGLGFVEGHGTTTEAQSYAFRANGLSAGTHVFRLRQVDFDGTVAYHGAVEVTVGVPGTHALTSAYPNPFNPQASFSLAVSSAQEVTVELFDALGRRVATLFQGRLEAGQTQAITIDGRDLPSGTYVYRAVGERFSESRRVTLLK